MRLCNLALIGKGIGRYDLRLWLVCPVVLRMMNKGGGGVRGRNAKESQAVSTMVQSISQKSRGREQTGSAP